LAVPQGAQPVDWIPNLAGRVDPQVEQAIQFLFRAVYSIRAGTGISTAGLEKITQVVIPGLTTAVTPGVVRSISPGGSNPLPGVGGNPNNPSTTPQPASLTPVTALPGPNDPLSVIGSTVLYQGVQWTYTLLPNVSPTPFWFRSSALGTTLQDTHANRLANYPATSYPVGTNFYETDTTITYQVQDIGGNVWLYVNGVFRDVLANIPTGLGVDDFGYWFKATDFLHDYNWDGTAWHFATSDPGSDFYTTTLNPAGPNGGLWGKADGSTYTVAQDNGTTANVTTSVTANTWLRR
jgi:hypothetical protein